MDYIEKCKKPIPIGRQQYAYQCERVSLAPVHGAIDIRGWKPMSIGKEPYPNSEKDKIEYYDLKIERFTGNSISLCLTKKFKDGSEEVFLTNVSFSDVVNRLFENHPANNWVNAAPKDFFTP